jgi:poly(3-hydroxybutyrate) depolymerase
VRYTSSLVKVVTIVALFLSGAAMSFAQSVQLAAAPCATPPVMHCPGANCPREMITNMGPATEPRTGRTFFLDYPCDLKKGEKVTFVLSLHGAGSIPNWQRHYFPLLDYKDKYRLVVATPFSPTKVWSAADDEYLQNVVNLVLDQVGRDNIKAFWLAGHSQGGATSSRLVCTDFFRTKVDGFLSLSGGRVGGSPQRSSNFQNLTPAGAPPPAGARGAAPSPPSCDFSHIYETGEHEIAKLPDTSSWAQKYGCEAKPKHSELVDTQAGYVYDGSRQNPGSKGWGLLPRPGKAEVFLYKGCKDGRVVADVMRLDKGHTEGLEPRVTEELVKLMVAARGGKIQK